MNKETYFVARNGLNTLLIRPMILGHIWVRFLSPFHYPIGRVRCRLIGGGQPWPEQETSERGEVYWPDVPLDTYQVKLTVDDLSITQIVPWLRTKDKVHEQRLMHAADLLGPASSPYGIQVRLIGLGYDCGTPDGNLSAPQTVEAIKQVQAATYFPVDGIASPTLQELLCRSFGA